MVIIQGEKKFHNVKDEQAAYFKRIIGVVDILNAPDHPQHREVYEDWNDIREQIGVITVLRYSEPKPLLCFAGLDGLPCKFF